MAITHYLAFIAGMVVGAMAVAFMHGAGRD